MQEANPPVLPAATNDTWRTWLITGARHGPVDRRRVRGEHLGLKRMLVEGMKGRADPHHSWKDFSDAMVRQAVGDAVRSLPQQDSRLVKLAYFGGFSNRQIAGQVGLTQATVQRRLRRALSAISDQIQHGRRLVYGLGAWLTGRWLSDAAHHAVQVAAVGSVAVIVAAQPAPVSATPPVPPPVRLVSAPAAAAAPAARPPVVQAPVPQVPVALPSLPSVPLPVKVKLPPV